MALDLQNFFEMASGQRGVGSVGRRMDGQMPGGPRGVGITLLSAVMIGCDGVLIFGSLQ